ncbi:MAG: TraR/DksA family transcriptional regulator [Pseudomonadota bacterium]
MTEYAEMAELLDARLADLLTRAEVIEDDLRHPLDADSSEQAVDLADDEALEGIDDVLRAEIQQIRLALRRIENGAYGKCSQCREPIGRDRLKARPIATTCIKCASEG